MRERSNLTKFLYTGVDGCKVLLKSSIKNRFPYRKTMSGRIAILANGPSMKEVLKRIENDAEFKGTEFFVMNYFCVDPVFFRIKPKYYALADPMFFEKDLRYEKVMQMFGILENHVDWEMNIYIPFSFGKKKFIDFSGFTNPHLHIIPINNCSFSGFRGIRNHLYKWGLSICPIVTVAQLCIYVSINLGFDEIRLYGVEHSLLNNICVDENNHLCNRLEHFYEDNDKSVKLEPMRHMDTGKIYSVTELLYECLNMFSSHELMADYADYIGTRIINCTPNSMIDSYPRM